ncbi:MAG: type II toxin-antitoxin system RelE/ParE family toxin [Candidatus Brocadia sp. WS118]|nr:MAG: type II toxin-antitoxin system RelE/ParE family toxin [Candidatus Brocadia sp. WS118]
MKSVIIHEDAEKELCHAVEYYEDKVTGLGLDFENEVRKALISIQENPKLYTETKHGVRRHLLQRFPYFIYYDEFDDYIWIIAFAHTSKKPFYWKKRAH